MTEGAAPRDPESAAPRDPWIDTEPELNARLLGPMLRFYGQRWGRPALIAFASRLGTTLDVLEDTDRWFSIDNFLAFNRAMVEETGDPEITYKAGLAFVEPGILGLERLFVRALLSPRHVYELTRTITARYSRVTDWTIEIQGNNAARIVFVPAAPEKDDLLFCMNRRGVLEAGPLIFGLPRARLEHPRCMHAGSDTCEYRVRWTNHAPYVRPAVWFAVAALVLALALYLLGSSFFPVGALVAIVSGVAAVALVVGNAARVMREASALAGEHAGQLGTALEEGKRRVEQLLLLQAINEVAARLLDEDELLDAVLDKLAQGSTWDRVLLLLVDESKNVLGATRSRGFGAATARVERLEVSLTPNRDDERLFANILTRGEPLLIDDVAGYAKDLLPANRALMEQLGSRSLLAVPVEGRGRKLGLLVVDRLAEGAALDGKDRDQLRGVASALGVALSNARLFAQVRQELLKNRKYSQFLPSPVVKQIQDDPEAALRLGGKRRSVALMFCDIAGFTKVSAESPPEEVVRGLNAWFGIADPVIEACGGIVDKRMGDGILVVFLEEDDARAGRHPVERAAAAAVGMHDALEQSRGQLGQVVPRFAGIAVRWAVHWGEVIAGNLGSQARFEYTVIGDAVNACARLEEVTPAGHAWFTGEAVRAVPGGLTGALFEQSVTLRGRPLATEIYSIALEGGATQTGTWAPAEHGATTSVVLTDMDLGPAPDGPGELDKG